MQNILSDNVSCLVQCHLAIICGPNNRVLLERLLHLMMHLTLRNCNQLSQRLDHLLVKLLIFHVNLSPWPLAASLSLYLPLSLWLLLSLKFNEHTCPSLSLHSPNCFQMNIKVCNNACLYRHLHHWHHCVTKPGPDLHRGCIYEAKDFTGYESY